MREFDRCDQIRSNALAFAVEFHSAHQAFDPGLVANTAGRFLKFLLGGHESLTEKEVVEMEEIIRQDEKPSNVRTFTGRDPVELPADVEAS